MRRCSIENRNSGSGLQNNNNATGTQNNYFENIVHTAASYPHKTLLDAVADVGASHTAEQQYLRGKCLEGTRKKVLRNIWEWLLVAEGKESPICWLWGTAGVGKSAIAMTIANASEQEGLLISSFFFFRSDSKRNVPDAVVFNIAQGLVSTVPFMRCFIEPRISKDPQILKAALEAQLSELILKPTWRWSWLRCIWVSLLRTLCLILSGIVPPDIMWALMTLLSLAVPPHVPNIVIIDGLDECCDPKAQLRILNIVRDTVQQAPHFPMRFLICSRPEGWIREAFTAIPEPLLNLHRGKPLSELSRIISLDDDLGSDEDIRLYYRHCFQEIVSRHKYRQVQFSDPWPTEEELEALVDHSCRQFVYATTVVGFIEQDDNDPTNQLRLLLKKAPCQPGEKSPYGELDRLYTIILEAATSNLADHREELHSILAAILVLPTLKLSPEPTPVNIQLLLGLPSGRVTLRLWRLHSVLRIGDEPSECIRIHHTSFQEYLVDKTRSVRFQIDTEMYNIARRWVQNVSSKKIETYSYDQFHAEENRWFFTGWVNFLKGSIPNPTQDLLDDLWNADLASLYLANKLYSWEGSHFQTLVPWVRKYAFPDSFSAEARAMKEQVFALPWAQQKMARQKRRAGLGDQVDQTPIDPDEFDDFRRVRRDDTMRLKDIAQCHYPPRWDYGHLEWWEDEAGARTNVDRSICVAEVDGTPGAVFTAVSYSGPEARKAFEEDLRMLTRTPFPNASQVYAVDVGVIPSLVLRHELVPAAQLLQHVGILGWRYLSSLVVQFGCKPEELWMDALRGTFCWGPPGPYPGHELRLAPFDIEDLPSTVELVHEDVLLRFLASRKSMKVDRDIVEAITIDSISEGRDAQVDITQPTAVSTLTNTPIAAADNILQSKVICLSDRKSLKHGLTR
ncbi:hypothetical protein PQX77_016995 [Marasmius sp. AFHP31]|nr:hypothetical protein PQX77_016995 [Marasmius sp. AFHP31]